MSIYIIGEIGINHNGDLDICKKLIEIAKHSGCNAVKFQKRDIDLVYTNDYLNSYRESPWGSTQRDQKKGLEFDLDQYKEINRFCSKIGIEWFASAWDEESQNFLNNFDLPHNKIASAMIISNKFLERVASEGKHTFISTGMSTLKQIDEAVDIFKQKNCSFELMHTVSTYPMKDSDANLNTIKTLKNRYNCNVGYSGHESGVSISIAAAALDITSLERHITIDRAMYGSDQAASLEPNGLRQLVSSVRKIESAMGDGIKKIIKDEELIADKLRAHL